jgi:ABC-2 type transport system permease protein
VVYLNIVGDGRRRGPGPSEGIGGLMGGVDLTGLWVCMGVLAATAMVFGRIAETSISMEGKSWWLLKAAPISGSELLRGKLLSAMIPFAVLSTLLFAAAATWKAFSPAWALYGWYGIELVGAGMLAISVGLSVPWARLNWDDPRKMSNGWASLLSFLAWVALGVIAGAVLCLPLLAEMLNPSLILWAALAGIVFATALTIGAGFIALSFGVSRVPTVGES